MRKLINLVKSHGTKLAALAMFGGYALSIIVSVKCLLAFQELVKKVRVIYEIHRYANPHYFDYCTH